MKTTYALLVTGLAAQQVAATWNFFDNFKTPLYNDNECSDKQKGGFDWSDLKDGDKNFQYGDFDFSKGWSCSNSFGKRDLLTKRTFGNKVIKNKVSKDKPASFGCNKRKSGFSITEIDVSVEVDVELELHYTMTDGSKCKSYSPCSASGSTIKNTQCGGATSVDVYLGSHYKGDKSECEIGFHNIGFDCNPGTGYNPPSPPEVPSSSTPSESKPAESTPQSQPPATPTGGVTSPPSCEGQTCSPQSTPEASTPPATETCNGNSGEGCNTPIQTPPSDVPYSSGAPFTNSSAPAYTPPPTYETTAVTPPSQESSTATPLPETSTEVSPPTSSAVVTPPASSAAVTPPTISTASPQPSSPSYPPTTISDVLPKCMNSWLQIDSSCKDNTDKSCYCVNPDFTKNVIDCVSAWCGTDEETKQTLQYLIGICAEYVPQNPGIIENCPTYIPLNPAPATPTQGVTGGVSTTAAASETPAASVSVPCTTITYGTTSLTVPQVHFTTQTEVAGANPTQPVGLVPGTAPPQTPATTTAGAAPYPIPSTLGTRTAPAGTGTGTGAIRPSSPAEFTGAASSLHIVPQGALFGAALALFAL
ncbi:Nn.00g086410.m01.CDS01 [Neocucurbitaria sp. VM-36]